MLESWLFMEENEAGLKRTRLSVLFAIDVSGSMSEHIKGEIKNVIYNIDSWERYRKQACLFDRRITKYWSAHYFRQAANSGMPAGGGTDYAPVFREANTGDYHAVIIFTDGYGELPRIQPGIPVTWVLVEDDPEIPNWGNILLFNPKQEDPKEEKGITEEERTKLLIAWGERYLSPRVTSVEEVMELCRKRNWDLPAAINLLAKALDKVEEPRGIKHGSCQDTPLRQVAQLMAHYDVPVEAFYNWTPRRKGSAK